MSTYSLSLINGQRHMKKNSYPHRIRQRGAIFLLGALKSIVILVFAGIAIDFGRYHIVKAELQNAADAAALAGAGCLVSIGGAGDVCDNTGSSFPDLDAADTRVDQVLEELNNKSENVTVSSGTVEPGFVDLDKEKSIKVVIPEEQKATYKAANPKSILAPVVKVTVERKGDSQNGVNGGAMKTYFLNVAGISSIPVSATAIAGRYSLGETVKVMPMAISSCYFNALKNDKEFNIGTSDIKICGGESAVWSSLRREIENASELKSIFEVPSPVKLGDQIYIPKGEKAALFGEANTCGSKGNKKCEYMAAPVINGNANGEMINPKGKKYNVVEFTCLNIISASQSGKYITVKFVSDISKCEAVSNGSGPGDLGSTWEISSSRLFN